MSNTNRTKGHSAERLYAKVFRKEMGFSECVTSRYGSRLHDDSGIDLINLPFNIQIKAGKQRGMNPSKVLNYMKERIKELFSKDSSEHDKCNIVIHRKEVKRGQRRTQFDDIVYMSFKDFKKLIITNGKNICNTTSKNRKIF